MRKQQLKFQNHLVVLVCAWRHTGDDNVSVKVISKHIGKHFGRIGMYFPSFLKTYVISLGKELGLPVVRRQDLQKHTGPFVPAVAVTGDNAMRKGGMKAFFTGKVK